MIEGRILTSTIIMIALLMLSGCASTAKKAPEGPSFTTATLGQDCAYIRLNGGDTLSMPESQKLWQRKAAELCGQSYDQVLYKEAKVSAEGIIKCDGERSTQARKMANARVSLQAVAWLDNTQKLARCFTNEVPLTGQCQPIVRNPKSLSSTSTIKYVNKAYQAYVVGNRVEAIRLLEKASSDEEFDKAYVARFLGVNYAEIGQYSKALELIGQAVDANVLSVSEHLSAMSAYADLLFKQKNYHQAIIVYQARLEAECQFDTTHTNVQIAKAYIALGDVVNARLALANAAETKRKPTFDELWKASPQKKAKMKLGIVESKRSKLSPVFRIEPAFPIEAINKGVRKGWVRLVFDLGELGTTENIRVNSSSSKLLVRSAIKALQKWKFVPERINSKPVSSKGYMVKLEFDYDSTPISHPATKLEKR